MGEPQINSKKNKKITVVLALLGALQPTPLPVAGIHKFYLGQYEWGIVYMIFGVTQISRIACAAEGLWYLVGPQLQRVWARKESSMTPEEVLIRANVGDTVDAMASSLREIESLRREGLLSEYEFEQKRRSLLEQIP